MKEKYESMNDEHAKILGSFSDIPTQLPCATLRSLALRQAFRPEQDPDSVQSSAAPLQARFPIQEFSSILQLTVGGTDCVIVGRLVGRSEGLDDGAKVGPFDGDRLAVAVG